MIKKISISMFVILGILITTSFGPDICYWIMCKALGV